MNVELMFVDAVWILSKLPRQLRLHVLRGNEKKTTLLYAKNEDCFKPSLPTSFLVE
jgi:hypothetical protein